MKRYYSLVQEKETCDPIFHTISHRSFEIEVEGGELPVGATIFLPLYDWNGRWKIEADTTDTDDVNALVERKLTFPASKADSGRRT